MVSLTSRFVGTMGVLLFLAGCSVSAETQANSPTDPVPTAANQAPQTVVVPEPAADVPQDPTADLYTGFWSYLIEPETDELREVSFWLSRPGVHSAHAAFGVQDGSGRDTAPLMRMDLATGESRQLAELASGAELVAASQSEVIARVDSGPSTTNNDEGATYFRLDATTGESLGQFETLVNSSTAEGSCRGPLRNLRELPDGRLIGKIGSYVPAVFDPTTATITQLVPCGDQSARIGDFLDTDDFEAATSFYLDREISDGRNQEFLGKRPYLGTGTFVEGRGDLWWIFQWGSNSSSERWRSAAVVRFDLETESIVDMWPVGKAADFFSHCVADKPGCVSRSFENLAWVDGKLIADHEFRSSAEPQIFIFDPETGEAEILTLETTPGFAPDVQPLELLHANGDHAWFALSGEVVSDASGDAPRFWIGRLDVSTKTIVRVADF